MLLRKPNPQPTAPEPPIAPTKNSQSPAISTNPTPEPQNPAPIQPFNPPTQKIPAISTIPQPKSTSDSSAPSLPAVSPTQSTQSTQPAAAPLRKRRKNDPILAKLTSAQKEALIALYEQHSGPQAVQLAQQQLNLHLSVSTLCRLYTTHQIAEDQHARDQYLAQTQTPADTNGQIISDDDQILLLADSQLRLRLLELASRRNPGAPELRLLGQLITRLQALRLSERRVVAVEKREARLAAAGPARSDRKRFAPQPAPSYLRPIQNLGDWQQRHAPKASLADARSTPSSLENQNEFAH